MADSDAVVQEEPHQNGVLKAVDAVVDDPEVTRLVRQRQNSIDQDAQDMVIDSLRDSDAVVQEEPHQNGVSQAIDAAVDDLEVSRPDRQRQNSIDRDAQDMVIDSLRAQIQDLISQVSQLNNKLVKSYDRVSDLEDDLHVASANVRASSVKISQLELERTQHLSALNTGLLVEKSHVTSELTRLMEKATEEAAQRGQAESARHAIEKDLDDLSATLFGQANSMVAEARYDKHLSERKVEEAERALKSAEEVVQLMQTQMQTMQTEKEEAEKGMREMEQVMGKGKWVATRNGTSATLRLMSMHSPYQEYLSFIAHLRVLHPTSPNPPAMTTLLQLAFMHRLLVEDSEPTVRLDLAPSLNWLSRRSVLTAIHSGQLTIEPMSATTLFAESTTYPATTVAGMNSTHDNISCALCGVPIFPNNEPRTTAPSHNTSQNSWSGSFFKKSLTGSLNGTQPSSPTNSTRHDSIGSYLNSQVFIFRMASLPTTSISSLPMSLAKSASASNSSSPVPSSHSSSNGSYPNTQTATPVLNSQPTTIYPLCMSGWCLMRLRTTCTLWAFVRTGIVDKVWEEELPPPPPPPAVISVESNKGGDKPPIPPRKRGLWGIASAIGERAASWSGNEEDKLKKASSTTTTTAATTTPATTNHPLPPPPPMHPAVSHVPPPARRLPPPLPPKSGGMPPPLPKRNEGRRTVTAPAVASEKSAPLPDQPEPEPAQPAYQAPAADAKTTTSPKVSLDLPSAPTQDEPVVPVADAISPASHPLPESRPATPSGPSRTTSPAVVIHAGSPAPPLPRRAAARGRPVPGASRPSTPANADTTVVTPASPENKPKEEVKEEVKEVIKEDGPKEESKVDEEVKVNGSSDEATAGDAQKEEDPVESEVSVAQPDRSTQSSPGGTDVFVDASTPGEEVAQFVEATVDDASISEVLEKASQKAGDTTQDHEVDDKATIVDIPIAESDKELSEKTSEPETITRDDHKGDDLSTPVILEKVMEEPLPETDAEVKASAEAVKAEKEAAEEEKRQRDKEEKYKAGYVGDGTWEEKTWKELVRLREDMFWARIGGFRD